MPFCLMSFLQDSRSSIVSTASGHCLLSEYPSGLTLLLLHEVNDFLNLDWSAPAFQSFLSKVPDPSGFQRKD